MSSSGRLALVHCLVIDPAAASPMGEAVGVIDGEIVAVDDASQALTAVGEQAEVVDCQGAYLLPGFHDSHVHLLACIRQGLSIPIGAQDVSSIAAIVDLVAEAAAGQPAEQWIHGAAYDEFHLAEGRHPNRWDLDASVPAHPVKLRHRSGHACVLNSRGLALAGISGDFRPPRGATVERDADGEPTGLLYDMEEYLENAVGSTVEATDLRDSWRELGMEMLSAGLTSVQDASAGNGLDEWRLFSGLLSDRPFPRVTMMAGFESLADFAGQGMGFGDGDNRLRLGHCKIVLRETTGGFLPSVRDLQEQVWTAHHMGFPVAIHCIEESAVLVAAEAIAAALERLPMDGHLHRLEHASVVPPALVERIGELGISVCTQPVFLFHNGDRYLRDVEPHSQAWLYPVRSLLQAGIAVTAGSDAPVADFHPLLGVSSAVTRRSRGGQVVGRDERVSAADALRMYTAGSAAIAGQSAWLGRIAVGQRADLVLLSKDPRAVAPSEIANLDVLMTTRDGDVVWRNPL